MANHFFASLLQIFHAENNDFSFIRSNQHFNYFFFSSEKGQVQIQGSKVTHLVADYNGLIKLFPLSLCVPFRGKMFFWNVFAHQQSFHYSILNKNSPQMAFHILLHPTDFCRTNWKDNVLFLNQHLHFKYSLEQSVCEKKLIC